MVAEAGAVISRRDALQSEGQIRGTAETVAIAEIYDAGAGAAVAAVAAAAAEALQDAGDTPPRHRGAAAAAATATDAALRHPHLARRRRPDLQGRDHPLILPLHPRRADHADQDQDLDPALGHDLDLHLAGTSLKFKACYSCWCALDAVYQKKHFYAITRLCYIPSSPTQTYSNQLVAAVCCGGTAFIPRLASTSLSCL